MIKYKRRHLREDELLKLATKKVELMAAQSRVARAKAESVRLMNQFEKLWDEAFPEDTQSEHTDEIVLIDRVLWRVHLPCSLGPQYFDVTPVNVIEERSCDNP